MNPKKKFKVVATTVLAFVFLAGFSIYVAVFPFGADSNPTIATSIYLPVNNERFVYTDTPLIQGKSTTGNTINIFDNGTQIGNAVSDATGSFYYKTSNPFSSGIHKIEAINASNPNDTSTVYISIDTSDPSKAILTSEDTSIIENDHKYFGSGDNRYDAIVRMMGNETDQAQVETDFANAEKAGIKMLRVINYMLDDMALPNPTTAPVYSVSDGGGIIGGNYIYRYSCINLSKNRIGKEDNVYHTAETLPSNSTEAITVLDNQKVTLTLAPCAKSYRYLVYRRNSGTDLNTETYLGFAQGVAGQNATFVDDGSYRPSGVWPDPVTPPTLATQARTTNPNITTRLEAGDYIYKYIYKEQRKPVDGRYDKFIQGYDGTYRTAGSQSAQVSVIDGEAVNISVPAQNSPWAAIFRRKASDPEGSEKYIALVRNVNGSITYVDEGIATDVTTIPTSNSTEAQGMSDINNTHNNPRSAWPTEQSTAFMTGYDNWNESALVASDKVLALAKKYNIRIMFVFVDQHDNNTGGIREIARNCGTWDSNFFADTCSKDTMKAIINKFTNRVNTITGQIYKNDPAIFSWELNNEAWETGNGGRFRSWIWEMGLYLKDEARDSNHMLASGDLGEIWFTHNYEASYNAGNNHDFVTMGTPDPIDLLTWHGYPDSEGHLFNHGYYGEFDPTDPAKRGGMTDEAAAAWSSLYGPVLGPISIDKAIEQLRLHAHYATLLNKPVVFGEWGLGNHEIGKDGNNNPIMESNWLTTGPEWIRRLSDAILTAKPDLIRGPNIYSDSEFTNNPDDLWIANNSSLNVTNDDSLLYENHSTLKISPTSTNGSIISQRFTINPNSPHWFEYLLNNPTTKNISISVNAYYKNGSALTGVSLPSVTYNQTVGWKTLSNYSTSRCEFTTPDADQVDFKIVFYGEVGEEAHIGKFGFYQLVSPGDSAYSTFSSTGWWSSLEAEFLGNPDNREALKIAAINFANASMVGLDPLFVIPPPEDNSEPIATDTSSYLTLPMSRFSNSWNMVSFPDTSGSVTDDSLIPSGFRIRRFDTASNSYKKGENSLIELRAGQGFWLNIDDINKVSSLKYPLTSSSSTEIAVTKGWNLLGNPYQSDLPLSNLKVKYKDGTTRSYSDAIVRKEVSGYAWSYEGSEKKYYFIAINPNNYKTDSPKNTVIKPFRGFWTIIKSDKVSSVIMNK